MLPPITNDSSMMRTIQLLKSPNGINFSFSLVCAIDRAVSYTHLGRPDELVRGVILIGTPLSMFSNIVCAGDDPSVFVGICGAESGGVQVTAISPTILVSKIETQRAAKSSILPPILPRVYVPQK